MEKFLQFLIMHTQLDPRADKLTIHKLCRLEGWSMKVGKWLQNGEQVQKAGCKAELTAGSKSRLN